MTDLFLKAAGELAAQSMETLWSRDIIDPSKGSKHPRAAESLAVINEIIRLNGWGWTGEYKGNGPPQWCGMTAGKAWTDAGIDTIWLVDYFASTDRLVAWAGYQRFQPHSKANPAPAAGEPRRVLVKLERGKPVIDVRRGDIVIVGNGKRTAGDHVTIAVGVLDDGATIDTISGNGGGVGPDGASREGVSRRYYRVGASDRWPMWLVRPAPGDIVNFSVEKPTG